MLAHALLRHPADAADHHQPRPRPDAINRPQQVKTRTAQQISRRRVLNRRCRRLPGGRGRGRHKSGGRILQQLRQPADDHRKRHAQIQHRLLQPVIIQQPFRNRRQINRGQPEPRHHQARHQTRLGRRKPLQRRRRGRGIATANAQPHQHPKPQQPGLIVARRRNQHHPRPHQQTACGGRHPRTKPVLAAPCKNHGKREHQTTQRIRIIELTALPAKLLFDGRLEQAPRVEHAECEIDAETGAGHEPAGIFGCLSHEWELSRTLMQLPLADNDKVSVCSAVINIS